MPLPNNESKPSQPFPRKKKDRERIHFPRYIVLFLAFIAFSACGPSVQEQSKTVELATQTIHPEIVPSDTVILNPGTGLYEWRGHNYIEDFEGTKIAYDRFSWRQLETSEGVYDFSSIRQAIEQMPKGQRFAFRIRDIITDEGIAVPDYIIEKGYGFWDDDVFIPDYNHPEFQAHRNAFLKALGEEFNGDPQIAFIDIGMLGNLGEWHLHGVDYDLAGNILPPTEEAKRMIIDKYIEYFPNVQLLLFVNNPDNTDVIIYAIQKYADLENPLGTRNDCMGDEHFGRMFDLPQWQYLQFQWKVGPMVTEFCGVKTTDLLLAPQQVIDGHVSLVSNGNMGKRPKELSPEEIDAVTEAANHAGYRFVLNSITLPETITLGTEIDVSTSWSNLGNTPAYSNWVTELQLREPETNTIVWKEAITLSLRCTTVIDILCLLPTTTTNADGTIIDSPRTVVDTFTVQLDNPDSIFLGKDETTLALTIQVKNANQEDEIWPFLSLANKNVDPETRVLFLEYVEVARNPQ